MPVQRNNVSIFKRWFVVFFFLAVTITGCGESSSPSSSKVEPKQVVSESEHQKFEKLYTEQCIKSQQHDSQTQLTNDQALGEVCQCMAKAISKRLSKADAVHFIEKKEFPFDLVMMTNAAANTCLTNK